MADRLKLEIATPDRLVIEADADEVVLPSVCGSMGVLPGHAPLLATLDIGEISYRVADRRRYVAVSGGFAEVLRDGVQILAETAEPAEEIDVDRAKLAKERAEERLRAGASDSQFSRAEVSLRKAVSRIRIHSRLG